MNRGIGIAAVLASGMMALGAAQPPPGMFEGDFIIASRSVTPDRDYVARFRVLGAEISAGGEYDMPVTVEIVAGGSVFQPFGSFEAALAGNVNDGNHPKDFILPEPRTAGTSLTVRGRSWSRLEGKSGAAEADWQKSLTVSATERPANMLVLRNGDPVPQIEPFLDQQQIGAIVRDYVDPATNTIQLWEDEAIFLFELGATDLSAPAADFQDLVVLVTLAADPIFFEGPRIFPDALGD